MATNNAINSSLGNRIYSLSPYIVGTDEISQFSTIQSAIDQAAADGASSANQKTVFIKNGTYSETLALSDGINLVGFDSVEQSTSSAYYPGTILDGLIKIPNPAVCKISGINIVSSGSACFDINTNALTTLVFENCTFTTQPGSSFVFDLTNKSDLEIFATNCFFASESGIFNHNENSAKTIKLDLINSTLYSRNPSEINGSGVNLVLNAYECSLSTSFNVGLSTQLDNMQVNFWGCEIVGSTDGSTIFRYNILNEGPVEFDQCNMLNAVATVDNSSNGSNLSAPRFFDCVFQYDMSNSFAPGTAQGTFDVLDGALTTEPKRKFKSNVNGFTDAFSVYAGNSCYASSGVGLFPIARITIPTGYTFMCKGTVAINVDNLSDYAGAEFSVCAHNTAGTVIVVGTPTVSYMNTGGVLAGATLSFNGSGSELIVYGLGIAATDIDWAVLYQGQLLSTKN